MVTQENGVFHLGDMDGGMVLLHYETRIALGKVVTCGAVGRLSEEDEDSLRDITLRMRQIIEDELYAEGVNRGQKKKLAKEFSSLDGKLHALLEARSDESCAKEGLLRLPPRFWYLGGLEDVSPEKEQAMYLQTCDEHEELVALLCSVGDDPGVARDQIGALIEAHLGVGRNRVSRAVEAGIFDLRKRIQLPETNSK